MNDEMWTDGEDEVDNDEQQNSELFDTHLDLTWFPRSLHTGHNNNNKLSYRLENRASAACISFRHNTRPTLLRVSLLDLGLHTLRLAFSENLLSNRYARTHARAVVWRILSEKTATTRIDSTPTQTRLSPGWLPNMSLSLTDWWREFRKTPLSILMSPLTNASKRRPKLEQQYSAFLPSSDTQRFTSTPNRATDRTKNILDCRQETTKRADRLHISSEKGSVLNNKGIKLSCMRVRWQFQIPSSSYVLGSPRSHYPIRCTQNYQMLQSLTVASIQVRIRERPFSFTPFPLSFPLPPTPSSFSLPPYFWGCPDTV